MWLGAVDKVLDLWNKTPGLIKWPFVIIIVPNTIVTSCLFIFVGVPWVDTRIEAQIIPRAEKRDMQIKSMVDAQNLQYEGLKAGIQRIEQHQAIMYQALLDNKNHR
jgi:hypothetical protein